MVQDPLLIFDLGNVILRHDNKFQRDQILARCADPQEAAEVLARADDGRKDAGACTTRQFFDGMQPSLGFDGDYAAFEALWCCHFSHDGPMEQLVKALASRYRLVVLSNTDDAHWAFLKREYPILAIPRALYASFEMKLLKPDPQIYLRVLQAERRKPNEAVFIDDKVENVEAANSIGIHGILFTGRVALEAELQALGISI